ncbi:MAG: hypothetical protein BWY50_00412 [Spirochaetes bacterium ADurb.Bin315]|nr:MAG: hypothetical protein BWY50_00412 [Spirochaetes bacterium ADurb.Bin315]
MVLAGGGVAGEGHAGSARLAHVSEDHRLNVDRSPQEAADIIHLAIPDRPLIVPGLEHRIGSEEKLFDGVVGEIRSNGVVVDLLIALDDFLQIGGIQIGIQFHAPLIFHILKGAFKESVGNPHDDIAEHLHEAAIAVPSEALVSGLCDETLDTLRIESEVQNRIHHSRH